MEDFFLLVVFDSTFRALFLFVCLLLLYGLADFEISNSMGTNQATNKNSQWTLVNPNHVNPKPRKSEVQNQLIND